MHYTTMDDSEKLLALKKAYADIILNTAKEAAARVMASERKATRFQQELLSTKDEALRMLLRLKQMLDSKVKESELTSLSQQKKIDELEAQLQEAEDIVSNLRAELREAETKLENATTHQMYPPVEQNIEGEIATQENCLQDNRFGPCDGSVHPLPDSHVESVSISDTRNPTVNGTNDSSKFCVSHDHTNNCFIHNPYFASIVIRRKEPELYRNGCTQRIRAFERSLFGGNMSVSGNLDNAQDETLVRVHEDGKAMPVTTNAKADTIFEKERPDELIVVKADADPVKVPARKKRRNFIKALRSRLRAKRDRKRNKASYLADAKDSPCVLDKNYSSRVNSSMECENEAQKNLARVRKEDKTMTVTTNAKADTICGKEKLDKLEVVKTDADLVKASVLKKRRLAIRLHPDQVKKTNEASYLSDAKGSTCVLDNSGLLRVDSSLVCEKEVPKDLMSPSFAEVPNAQDETLVRVNEDGKAMPVTTNAKADTIFEKERPDELIVVKADADPVKVPAHKKRRNLIKVLRSRLRAKRDRKRNKASYLADAKDSPCVLDKNYSSRVNSSMECENEAQKNLARVRKEDKTTTVTTNAKADTICGKEKLDKLEVVKTYADLDKASVHKKRRLAIRLHPDQVKKTNEASYLSDAKGSTCVLDNSGLLRVDSSLVCEKEAPKDLMSPSFAEVPNAQDETLVRVNEDGKAMPVTTNAKADTIFEKERPDELIVVKADADPVKVPAPKKRRNLFKALRSRLRAKRERKRNKALYLADAKDSPCVLDKNYSSRVNSSMECENEAQKNLAGVLKEDKTTTVTTNAKADTICGKEKLDKLEVAKTDADLVKASVHKKRRLAIRLHPDQVKKTNEASNLSDAKGSTCVLDNNGLLRVDSSLVCEKEAPKDLMSPYFAEVPIDETDTIEQSESHDDVEKGGLLLKACSARSKIKDDKEFLDKSVLIRQGSLSTEGLEVSSCKADVEQANGSPEKPDPKAFGLDEKVSCQPANDKFLKYTFRRKRKKESVSSAAADCSLENDSLKKSGEKENGRVEPQKSCPMTESSRDSRRLAQVARQLISLSEKKWWQ